MYPSSILGAASTPLTGILPAQGLLLFHRTGTPDEPTEDGEEVPTWEQSITLAEVHAERFHAMIFLAVDSGMRWGELIGLKRKNLDLANRRVRVVDQLVRTADGMFHRTQPKTSGLFARSRFRR